MAVQERYRQDVETILSKRIDNGADLWTTPDNRLAKGSPFSLIDCAPMLIDLGLEPDDPALRGCADLLWGAQREDGRFRLAPVGAIHPCQTIAGARALCYMGYASDGRLKRTFEHLLQIQHDDGGWRCNKFSYGRGPETAFSNPGPTLAALDAFRFTEYPNTEPALERAAVFLLDHWTTRKPLGPCHYGIGTLFMQVAYPFSQYNLFFYVYVLSFYDAAKRDPRFLEALAVMESKLSGGKVVIERPNRKLADLSFCKKGEASDLATERWREVLENIG